ncbi:MAG: tRNA (N6-isopentenyl adenosine(37)-C2)-methylthiotransferase MiaB [Candidatus Omnitrophota bacterium]|nr:tRNA (N6-isopentenyl adenosine(37)-C2)-methylthiotransferase MiaB [Candidatus Omnitrophota bacterium]
MNVRDSEAITGMMVDCGYSVTDNPKEADVVLMNTCSVRQHAEERAISNMGLLLKTKNQEKKIYGIIGCSAQSLKQELFKRLPNLDFIAGPSEISRIPKIIETIKKERQKVSAVDLEMTRPEKLYSSGYTEDKKHAYVNISEGCDNYCAYCVVPYVRGSLRHRKAGNIIKEIRKLVGLGITDVTLLGQNVNSYRYSNQKPVIPVRAQARNQKKIDFVELLRMVNDIEGLESFTFLSSHPKDALIKLFEAMRDLPRLKKYLHLPVQSGSDRILRLMNRGYTSGHYKELAADYRRIVPQGEIATDVIVGFPNETEKDFEDTLNLVKDIKFNSAYIFKYSPRPKTKAAAMPDDVPKDVKEKRHKILLDMQRKISRTFKKTIIALFLICNLSLITYNFSWAASLSTAQELFLRSDYDGVIKECKQELASSRRSKPEVNYLLALAYIKKGELTQAEDNFTKVITECKTLPVCNKALLGLGDVYFLKDDYNKAREIYLQVKESSRELGAQVYYRLAQVNLKLGDIEKAKEYSTLLKKDYPLSFEAQKSVTLNASDIFFTVQVGAFSSQKNASKLASDLNEKGFDAYIDAPNTTDNALYRVRVGKFKTKKEAESATQSLSEQGYPTKIWP